MNTAFEDYLKNHNLSSNTIKCRLPAQTATCAIFGGHSVT